MSSSQLAGAQQNLARVQEAIASGELSGERLKGFKSLELALKQEVALLERHLTVIPNVEG